MGTSARYCCTGVFTVNEHACKEAAAELGFDSSKGYEIGNWAHLPHGCFVGHSTTNWKYTYFNNHWGSHENAHAFKQICRTETQNTGELLFKSVYEYNREVSV